MPTQPTTREHYSANKCFLQLMTAELLARTGYQMGKSPLLPLFAAALGASSQKAGVVVAVSTVTGLLVSPLIGHLSDRWGRRGLLKLGAAIFAIVPFAYLSISTSSQLFMIRLVHGLATAVYGPVVSALVVGVTPFRWTGSDLCLG